MILPKYLNNKSWVYIRNYGFIIIDKENLVSPLIKKKWKGSSWYADKNRNQNKV